MKTNPILIVPGDPKSVFFEILFKSLKNRLFKSPIILICCKQILRKEIKKFKFKKKINEIDINELDNIKAFSKKLYLINILCKSSKKKNLNLKYQNKYIHKTFDVAIQLIKQKISTKLINGPINKENFLNKKFLGITEYISNKFKKYDTAMIIFNKNLAVSPITTHLPLKLVSKNINQELIMKKIKIVNKFYKKIFNKKPNLAVAGLNPHCESILKLNEDKYLVKNAVKKLIKQNIKISGPYSADTLFMKNNRKKFDVIIGMYHDQVLTPIKTLYEYDAINITAGLPFLRVSPDHGPNKKMIWKNVSNHLSIFRCLEFLDKK